MKKRFFYIVFVLLLSMLSLSIAQEVQYTNQITIAWDPVTQLTDGGPIPAEDVITYVDSLANKGAIESLDAFIDAYGRATFAQKAAILYAIANIKVDRAVDFLKGIMLNNRLNDDIRIVGNNPYTI